MRRPLLVVAIVLSSIAVGVDAHPGVGIVRDSRGNVYYTDLRQVWMISPSGERTVAVPNVHTHELYLDPSDVLYGEHLWYEGDPTRRWTHRIWRRTPDGRVSDLMPPHPAFRDQEKDFHFVHDSRGYTYWVHPDTPFTIRRRDDKGAVTILSRGHRQVNWMTATLEGKLFFIDNGDLVLVPPHGPRSILAKNFMERRPGDPSPTDSHAIMGLWADRSDNVYLAVYGRRLVKRVSPDGSVNIVVRSESPWAPTGGLIDENGGCWLLESSDSNAVRVRHLRNGETLATYQD